jgi:hypothetical protein
MRCTGRILPGTFINKLGSRRQKPGAGIPQISQEHPSGKRTDHHFKALTKSTARISALAGTESATGGCDNLDPEKVTFRPSVLFKTEINFVSAEPQAAPTRTKRRPSSRSGKAHCMSKSVEYREYTQSARPRCNCRERMDGGRRLRFPLNERVLSPQSRIQMIPSMPQKRPLTSMESN